MAVVRTETCSVCSHTRREHEPSGCTKCECDQRAPHVIVRSDGTETESWGKSEPFEKGNQAAVKHGARSVQVVSAKAQEILEQLMAEYPFVTELHGEAVERYCRTEARGQLLSNHIMQVVKEEGVEAVAPYLWTEATRADGVSQKLAQDLGLDPAGLARLAKDFGWAKHLAGESLSALRQQGQQLRQQRAAALPAASGAPSASSLVQHAHAEPVAAAPPSRRRSRRTIDVPSGTATD